MRASTDVRQPPLMPFGVLSVPFGAVGGYLTVALAYLLAQAGIGAEAIGALIAASFLPQTWKFLWAPWVDTTLTRKRWYVIGTVFTAAGMVAMGAVPLTRDGLPWLTAAAFVANFASTVLSMANDSLVAHTVSADAKGRAGGWLQAGNLGGGGIGGGAALWIAQTVPPPWIAGAMLGAVCLLCAIALRWIDEPVRHVGTHGIGHELKGVVRECWQIVRSRGGALGLFVCFLPLGTSAASNLWSVVAGEWHASLETVALATGTLSGIVSAFGCLVGGWWCDRIDRKTAYCVFGVVQAACAVAMATGPRSEIAYIMFTLAYAFISGLTYAGFSAVAFEAIGGGKAATKYSLFASLSNMPIAAMTAFDGWMLGRFGSTPMLVAEASIALAAIGAFVAALAVQRLREAKRVPTAPVDQAA